MQIAGIGIVTNRGRGIQATIDALKAGWVPPAPREGGAVAVYSVPPAVFTDRAVLGQLRRADRFGKMAVLAAYDAVQHAGLPAGSLDTAGVLVATGHGPHQTTFKFLDGIIDYGDAGVSPTLFSHSVHNAAAYYIASSIASHGPAMTLTRFMFSFQEALCLAQAWLEERRCRTVVLGAVDECGAVLEHVASRKLRLAADGRIRPFTFSDVPEVVPGEAAVFFVLQRGPAPGAIAEISRVGIASSPVNLGPCDLRILDSDGLGGDESRYQAVAHSGVPAASYSPLFGSLMTGSALSCAVAALMIRDQHLYASPIDEGPCGVPVRNESGAASLSRIECVRFDCVGSCAHVVLERTDHE